MSENKLGFGILDMLSDKSMESSHQGFTTMIHYSKLIPNEQNTYEMRDIGELATSIKNCGLFDNLLVKQKGDAYVIISGHRRFAALTRLINDEYHVELENIPCHVVSEDEDELLTEIKLHQANIQTRHLSDAECLQAILYHNELIDKAKALGYPIEGIKTTGKKRELIADEFNMSPRQVQKFLNIKDDDEAKAALQDGASINKVEQEYQERKGQSHKKPKDANKLLKKSIVLFDEIMRAEFSDNESAKATLSQVVERVKKLANQLENQS